ncbi:MAG: ATP-grasp domain-containing protein [Pseudomonadota bacterium]
MTTVLLTLGRLPKALALARACKRVGCRVLLAEPFRWHLCRPSRDIDECFRVTAPNVSRGTYLDELIGIVERESVDLIVPVSEEALHVVALHSRLPDGCRLWAAEQNDLHTLHDKLRFAELAVQRSLTVPETYSADDPGARELAIRQAFVEKPAHSCSGIGLRIANAGEAVSGDSSGTLVQAFVEGEHISSLSIVHEGREIGSVFYRGLVFAGTVAVCFERVDDCLPAQQWVHDFLADCDYSGFLAFDFIIDEQGRAQAIECNPRTTSGVHFFDEVSLGNALLNPRVATEIKYAQQTRFQWAYSTLTEAYAALFRFRPREFARCFREMLRARDVVWSLHDPLPFLLMTPMSWEILWPAMSSSATLGEATQQDIAWFGSGDAA